MTMRYRQTTPSACIWYDRGRWYPEKKNVMEASFKIKRLKYRIKKAGRRKVL